MFQILHDVNIDWLRHRRWFIGASVVLMLAGLGSAVIRQATGRQPFNLGVDFKGGTVVTARFRQKPSDDAIRNALTEKGARDAVVQPVTDRPDTVLIKVPLEGEGQDGRKKVKDALNTFGAESAPGTELEADQNAAYKIIGTDAVGAVAGAQLRNKAIAVTLAALVGILVYIAFRFEWTYGAAAVIAVFHDVLVTLGFFSIFQWEISLTVIAALLTLVGFSVNDTIVVFDRIRENRKLHRRDSLYKVTNDSINQTLSRTVIANGLVFLSVFALVLFGGDVLRHFSLALFVGVIFGTYSSIAVASPIMVWWEQRLEAANREMALSFNQPRVMKATGTAKSAKRSLRDASKPLH
ncbi:MAG TPA: protein translocase subunit SecF [Pyrinomonadaceae bacterium]|jgi:preprotein translocase subunit SecF|nr:protein translocase subunit SecF [Pyrinomonadaceae bacterium]